MVHFKIKVIILIFLLLICFSTYFYVYHLPLFFSSYDITTITAFGSDAGSRQTRCFYICSWYREVRIDRQLTTPVDYTWLTIRHVCLTRLKFSSMWKGNFMTPLFVNIKLIHLDNNSVSSIITTAAVSEVCQRTSVTTVQLVHHERFMNVSNAPLPCWSTEFCLSSWKLVMDAFRIREP